jgi:uncharacterized protein (DUF302 family)
VSHLPTRSSLLSPHSKRQSGGRTCSSSLKRPGLREPSVDWAILREESGLEMPRIVRYVIGNPLIMKEMVKQVPDAGSYAPVTILVNQGPDGVHLSYDRMAGFLSHYGDASALAVARNLDAKIEDLLQDVAG